MLVNINDSSLNVTASSTPTAYALPEGTYRVRVVNKSGDLLVLKGETSSSVTLVAPTIGTMYKGSTMVDSSVEVFDVSPGITHISIYSTGSGTVGLQFTYGQ